VELREVINTVRYLVRSGCDGRMLPVHFGPWQVLTHRRVIERTFVWMIRWRRLLRDYEKRIDVSKAMILVGMGGHASQKRPSVTFKTNSEVYEHHVREPNRLKLLSTNVSAGE
jgi:hypothetical protein